MEIERRKESGEGDSRAALRVVYPVITTKIFYRVDP
jgi:hypothetical protein